MQEIIIFLVAKCPNMLWSRFGPKEEHDWYVAMLEAVSLRNGFLAQGYKARILIVTGFCLKGHEAEWEIYVRELALLGVEDPIVIKDGGHTGDQVAIGEAYAKSYDAIVIYVPTLIHESHVRYYGATHHHYVSVWGNPSLFEAPKDFLMPYIAALIDGFGLRSWFENFMRRRRLVLGCL